LASRKSVELFVTEEEPEVAADAALKSPLDLASFALDLEEEAFDGVEEPLDLLCLEWIPVDSGWTKSSY
jgi:hypothetical protein